MAIAAEQSRLWLCFAAAMPFRLSDPRPSSHLSTFYSLRSTLYFLLVLYFESDPPSFAHRSSPSNDRHAVLDIKKGSAVGLLAGLLDLLIVVGELSLPRPPPPRASNRRKEVRSGECLHNTLGF